jgi:hypothetical protein
VKAPTAGLWRVARGDNPLTVPLRPKPNEASGATANRFDPINMDFGVLYFGSTLALVEEDWKANDFMAVGAVAADWRQRRTAVHVSLSADAIFVDVDSPVTHQFLRKELADELIALGVEDIDVGTVRGKDRRLTRALSEWTYRQQGDEGPIYSGLRYESRLGSQWECWAVFDDEAIDVVATEARSITLDMPELVEIAELFELQLH